MRIGTSRYPDMVDHLVAQDFPTQTKLHDASSTSLMAPRISEVRPLLLAHTHTEVRNRQRLLLDKIPTFDRIQPQRQQGRQGRRPPGHHTA